ncbi:DUF3389 domain-containing protein [Vibrio sp. LaRot3]|uniref:DUF3389 domain-containing protein n=1 Tax=Vibrio sp. LaRot3 TaxID=2998829 RepID=UPI0022CDD652|nr:DUF3389 domain-containing protein [Vibrio sp. LaRot3]MDA0148323.1 DUF3389 domain-containing protein [Vibrio sp. LaRot3]
MVIEFSNGKIIATAHEIVVRLTGDAMVTLQAQVDAVQLIGRGANVVNVNGSECKWSVKLDNQEQIEELASQIGIAIE